MERKLWMSDHGQDTLSGLLGVDGREVDALPEDGQHVDCAQRDSRSRRLQGGRGERATASSEKQVPIVLGDGSGESLGSKLPLVDL